MRGRGVSEGGLWWAGLWSSCVIGWSTVGLGGCECLWVHCCRNILEGTWYLWLFLNFPHLLLWLEWWLTSADVHYMVWLSIGLCQIFFFCLLFYRSVLQRSLGMMQLQRTENCKKVSRSGWWQGWCCSQGCWWAPSSHKSACEVKITEDSAVGLHPVYTSNIHEGTFTL